MTSSTETARTPQVAINDIGSAEDFLAAIDQTIKYFNDGDIVEGIIVKVDRDEVLLDIGYKTEGVIPSRELSIKHDVDPNEVVAVGDHVEALVLQKEDKEGRLILSKKRAQYERAWGTIEKIKDEGRHRHRYRHRGRQGWPHPRHRSPWLPAGLPGRDAPCARPAAVRRQGARSQDHRAGQEPQQRGPVPPGLARADPVRGPPELPHDPAEGPGPLRRRVLDRQLRRLRGPGRRGRSGARPELSWKHIDHPSEVVEVGQEVTVEVLDVDMDRERVSLSLKATQEDPWQQFARTHQIGQVVPGKVTKLVPFGAFVRVDEGIEGLVHISELAERHVEIPEQVVQVGDEIFVKVIDIDLDRRRISLSLKQANEGLTGDSRPTSSTRRCTAWPRPTTPRATTSTPRASTRRRASGSRATTPSARCGRGSTPRRRPASSAPEADRRGPQGRRRGRCAEEQRRGCALAPTPPGARSEETTGGALASDEALAALREKLAGGQS